MNETCSVRPVGGLVVGKREDYRPGPEPFRRDTGRITATARSDGKDKSDVATGVVRLNQQKTYVEMILDAVRDGHRSLDAIQSVTCFDRKKIRDAINKQVKAGNIMMDETAAGEKIFSLPGETIHESAVNGSQEPDEVSAEVEEVDHDLNVPEPMVDSLGAVVETDDGSPPVPKITDDDALTFSENSDARPSEETKGIEMEKSENDLGYLHERLEHLYRTAQSSLGAFWEAVVELRTIADDALLAKEKLLKVYDVLGQGCPAMGHPDKGGHSDVQNR